MNHIRAFLLFVLLSVAGSARAATVDAGHVQLELRPAAAAIAPGGTLYVALHQKIRPGWHTYWRNPGDAGEPPKLAWTLPPGWTAGDIVWPAPKRLPVGTQMSLQTRSETAAFRCAGRPIVAARGALIGIGR